MPQDPLQDSEGLLQGACDRWGRGELHMDVEALPVSSDGIGQSSDAPAILFLDLSALTADGSLHTF